MSKATKKKYVTKEVTEEFVLPDSDLQIVKVISSKGNNLHEVTAADSSTFLVSMPTKFRKNVWIKRGDYVMVKPIEEGDKVKAEIAHILYKPQIAYIQSENMWPASFSGEGRCISETTNNKTMTTTQQMIPDDMLPPSDESSCDESDDDNSDGNDSGDDECSNSNTVRQQRVHFDDSDDDRDCEDNCKLDSNHHCDSKNKSSIDNCNDKEEKGVHRRDTSS